MSRPFLDTNVLLYTLSADAAQADRAEALLAQGGVVSVQVLNEVTSVCLRKLRMPWDEIEAVLAAIKANCDVVPLTLATHEVGVQLARQYQLAIYDAMVCSAALLCGADTLLSEDMHDGLVVEGLTIFNPFR